MNTLILTVGLPRSGKSTWAKRIGLPIVNRDAIRLALHGQPFILEAESMVTAIEDYMVKSLFLAGHETIIVDATHLNMKYIERWQNKEWDVKFKVFSVSKAECIQRAIHDDKEYLIPIIEEMDNEKKFEVYDYLYLHPDRI